MNGQRLSEILSAQDFAALARTERPIFILASGQRCGSTLLQRLLNSCPNIVIWGEQHGYLNGFLREYRTLLDWESEYRSHREIYFRDGYDNFVTNMLPEERFLKRATILHLVGLFALPATSIGKDFWGFKEVRYDAEVALFLQRCFPEARIIHLTRNVVDCFISLKHWENAPGPWNRSWTEIFLEDWKRINASFLCATHRIHNLLRIRYEDMIENPVLFVGQLAEFVGMPPEVFDVGVFNKKIHREGPDGSVDKRPKILRSDLCDEEMELLSQVSILDVAREYGYTVDFK